MEAETLRKLFALSKEHGSAWCELRNFLVSKGIAIDMPDSLNISYRLLDIILDDAGIPDDDEASGVRDVWYDWIQECTVDQLMGLLRQAKGDWSSDREAKLADWNAWMEQ